MREPGHLGFFQKFIPSKHMNPLEPPRPTGQLRRVLPKMPQHTLISLPARAARFASRQPSILEISAWYHQTLFTLSSLGPTPNSPTILVSESKWSWCYKPTNIDSNSRLVVPQSQACSSRIKAPCMQHPDDFGMNIRVVISPPAPPRHLGSVRTTVRSLT